MCGFVHSTFLMVPVIFTGFVSSNSAANEWCATSGTPPPMARHAATTSVLWFTRFMSGSLSTAILLVFYGQ
jgi:hypothetical protein